MWEVEITSTVDNRSKYIISYAMYNKHIFVMLYLIYKFYIKWIVWTNMYRWHCSVAQVSMYEEVSGLSYTPVRQNGYGGLEGSASVSEAGTVWYIITRWNCKCI